jgi:hypothetical protein
MMKAAATSGLPDDYMEYAGTTDEQKGMFGAFRYLIF